jgi:proline dehydrogenase
MPSKLNQANDKTLEQWNKLIKRISKICDVASEAGIGVMIDAEETWLQDAIDYLVLIMMQQYNLQKPVIYNTIQLYRTDRYAFLERSLQHAIDHGYILGLKLVRGAYMEKERLRANKMGYMSPIQPNKTSTDTDFDKSVSFCLKNHQYISCIVASHNEKSNSAAATYIIENKIAQNHAHIHFSQLYGMSDNLTFNLANSGFNTSKYLPFGPVDEVIPYLMRRAEENSSISGQTGRELSLIKKECLRRGI